MDVTFSSFLGSGIATAIVTTIFGTLLMRRNERIRASIQAQLAEAVKRFESKRSWKERALFDLFGPLQMEFERTYRAFRRWNKRDFYLEAKVVREGNQKIRDLLLSNGHLIAPDPPDLMKAACQLIEHYDAWLQKYDDVRVTHRVPGDPEFVFTGPDGYPFPRHAEELFKQQFKSLQADLYGS